MKSRIREVAKHAMVYGLGSASTQLVGFLLLPIYTSHITTEEYGIFAIISAASSLLHVFLVMGFSTTIFKFYFRAENLEARKVIISSAFFWLSGVGIVFVGLFWIVSGHLARFLLGSSDYASYLRLMSVTLALSLLQIIPLGIFRARKKSWQYGVLMLSNFIASLGLNIYFVVSLHMGLMGILLANAIPTGLFAAIGLALCRDMLGPTFSWQVTWEMLRFGLPLVPSALSSYILSQADRWFLQRYSTMEVVGIYSLGYRFGSLINVFVVQPFQLIWLPIIFETEKKSDAKHFYEQMLTYLLLFSFWVGLGVSLFSREVLILTTTPAYHGAYATVPWIALAYVVYSAYMVVNIGIYLRNKTTYAIAIVGASALSNILFNFLLIPTLGALGAAQATLLSYIILFVIALQVNRRFLPLDYEWIRISKVTLAALGLFACGLLLVPASIYLSFLWKSALMFAYWGVLYVAGFYQQNELALVNNFLHKYLHRGAKGNGKPPKSEMKAGQDRNDSG